MSNKITFVWTDSDGNQWRKDEDYRALEAELKELHEAWEEMNEKRLCYREALERIVKLNDHNFNWVFVIRG